MDNGLEVTLEAVGRMRDILLLDMRGKTAYSNGHIDGAVCCQKDEVYPKDKPLVFYCQYGKQSLKLAEKYRSAGYDAYSLSGGYGAWLLSCCNALDSDELERYDRQIILRQLGINGQQKLKRSRVLIIGAGGLGCPCGMYLAGAGVGNIGIIDHDTVSLSNLNRQTAHRIIGENKALSLKSTLEAVNDRITVTAYPYSFSAENAAEILSGYDFVIDCCDSAETKFLINDMCVKFGKPFCYGGVIGFEGQVMTVIPSKTIDLRYIFGEAPTECETCSSYGIIGAAAGAIGCIQALETIKYIIGSDELTTDKMFIFDMLSLKSRIVDFRRNKNKE